MTTRRPRSAKHGPKASAREGVTSWNDGWAWGLLGLVLLIGACGCDNDNGADELSLNEYFSRLQALA